MERIIKEMIKDIVKDIKKEEAKETTKRLVTLTVDIDKKTGEVIGGAEFDTAIKFLIMATDSRELVKSKTDQAHKKINELLEEIQKKAFKEFKDVLKEI